MCGGHFGVGEQESEGSGVILGCGERFGETEVGSGERRVCGFALASEGYGGVQGLCGLQWRNTEGSGSQGGRGSRRVSRTERLPGRSKRRKWARMRYRRVKGKGLQGTGWERGASARGG